MATFVTLAALGRERKEPKKDVNTMKLQPTAAELALAIKRLQNLARVRVLKVTDRGIVEGDCEQNKILYIGMVIEIIFILDSSNKLRSVTEHYYSIIHVFII